MVTKTTETPGKGMGKPLSEVELQDRTVANLPDDFQFPLFNGRHALESQRRSGYKDSARAAREIVDNGYEAGAPEVRRTLSISNANLR